MARTEPARGMRDFLPEDVRRREYVIDVVKQVFERYGFEPLETPAVENLETLTGKYGEEGNQLIFKILKRGEHEATGQADLALRYDLTVPLARVLVHYRAKLPRPFKRYQIQPVWRADRPARGRFREFYQCDVDALGSRSAVIETELCSAASDVLLQLGFDDFVIRLNHRHLLSALLLAFGIPSDLHGSTLVTIDKVDKIGLPGVTQELNNRGLSPAAIDQIANFLGVQESYSELRRTVTEQPENPDVVARLSQLNKTLLDHAEIYVQGVPGIAEACNNLREVLQLTNATSAGNRMVIDLTLARGLSYYTGAIMEINVRDLAGSLGGGGRYDDLIGMFSTESIPAAGFSLGLERILVVMGERGLFPPQLSGPAAEIMIAIFSDSPLSEVLNLASRLRRAGHSTLVYPDPIPLGKQIRYAANAGIRYVAIAGPKELEAPGIVSLKDIQTGRQGVGTIDSLSSLMEILK